MDKLKLLTDIAKQFLIIILYFFLILIFQVFLINDITSQNVLLNNFSNLFINLFILVVFIFIFRKYLVPDFYEFKKNYKNLSKKYFAYWLIGFILSNIALNIIAAFIGTPSTQEINENYVLTYPFYSLINMVIIAPIFEELLTRVFFKNCFKNRYIYILLSGLLFGFLHLLTPGSILINIIPYTLLGASFSLIYYDSNNIWTNILYHSFNNLIAIIVIFIGVL